MKRRARPQAGYTYLLLLFAVAAMGLALAGVAENWSLLAQRERETELLFVGSQYRDALRRYHDAIPTAARRYPGSLDELLADSRAPVIRHHLRRLYPDPMTGKADWVLLRRGEDIVGLHSRNSGRPVKRDGFEPRDRQFAEAGSYQDWKFAIAAPTSRATNPDQESALAGRRPSIVRADQRGVMNP